MQTLTEDFGIWDWAFGSRSLDSNRRQTLTVAYGCRARVKFAYAVIMVPPSTPQAILPRLAVQAKGLKHWTALIGFLLPWRSLCTQRTWIESCGAADPGRRRTRLPTPSTQRL